MWWWIKKINIYVLYTEVLYLKKKILYPFVYATSWARLSALLPTSPGANTAACWVYIIIFIIMEHRDFIIQYWERIFYCK